MQETKLKKIKKIPDKLPHIFTWYADLYKLPVRTLVNARQRGWDITDPADLFKKLMRFPKKPRTSLSTLAKLAGKSDDLAEAAESASELEPSHNATVLSGGLLHELKRLKRETNKAYRDYINEKDPGDKLLRQKIYLYNVSALRLLAKEAPKAEREARNVLVVSDVESVWTRAMVEFKTSIELLGRRLATNSLFGHLNPVDVEQNVSKETTQILKRLESAGWITIEKESDGDGGQEDDSDAG